MESTKAVRETARRLQLEPLIVEQKKRLDHARSIRLLFRSAMDALKEGHNKNYHDLAVKSTISGYDEYLAEIIGEETVITEDSPEIITSDMELKKAQDQTYEARKDIGRMFQLLKAMKEGYNTEYNDEAVLKAISVLDGFAPSWVDEQNEFVGEEAVVFPQESNSESWETPESDQGKQTRSGRHASTRLSTAAFFDWVSFVSSQSLEFRQQGPDHFCCDLQSSSETG